MRMRTYKDYDKRSIDCEVHMYISELRSRYCRAKELCLY